MAGKTAKKTELMGYKSRQVERVAAWKSAFSLSSTRQKRTDLMARLREIEDLLLEETQEQVMVEKAATLLTQIDLFWAYR